MGRTPTSREFYASARGLEGSSIRLFGGYTALLIAAGLEQNRNKPKKIDNRIFEKDIAAHLEAYEDRLPSNPQEYPTIAVISDAHFPFENEKVINAFYAFIKDFRPQYVIANGDMVDFYSFSRFPRSHNVFTPRDEVSLSRKKHETFWSTVTSLCPESKKINLLGNHCVRPLKQVLEAYPAAEDWIQEALKRQFTFDGVETIMDPTEEYHLPGNILVHHGYRSKIGDHRDYTFYNCISGHTHQGGVSYKKIRGQTLWELNSGLSGDPNAKGLSYRPQKITTWTPGFGAVDKFGARFIAVD